MTTLSKNIAIILNPSAGSGRGVILAKKITDHLFSISINHFLFNNDWPSSFSGFSDAWIVGGDGTLNYFINKYPDIDIPLMIFKGGSGNDFQSLLYGNKTVVQMISIGISGEAKKVDAGICNEKYFINCAGIGFEGAVVEKIMGKNKRVGKIDFYIAILKRIFFYMEQKLKIKDGSIDLHEKCLMVSVMNGKTSGGGFMVGPKASINDGFFEINIVKALSPIKRIFYLPVIEKGKHIGLPFVHYHQAQQITIQSENLIPAHLDGEYYSAKSLTLKLLPEKYLFRY